MSDSDDEPAWVVEQSSAQKARRDASISASSSPDAPPSSSSEGGPAAAKRGSAAAEGAADSSAAGKAAAKGKAKGPPATSLPLLLAPKVKRDTLLVEAVDPELDLSGDFGCIGRLHVNATSSSSGEAGTSGEGRRGALTLDLKGKVYEGDVVPTNSTLCLISIDGNKAKVESCFSEFIQLSTARASIFDMETVQEGGFDASFFDDGDGGWVSNDGSDAEEELGPLKQKRGGGKMAAAKSGGKRKAAAGGKKKAPPAKKAKPAAAGGKKKA